MARRRLSDENVVEIKRLLWLGKTHEEVSLKFGLSRPYVSMISCGRAYQDIPWPTGAVGPLSLSRINDLAFERRARQGSPVSHSRKGSAPEGFPQELFDEEFKKYERARQEQSRGRDREEDKRLKEYAKTQYLTPEESAKVSDQTEAAPVRKEGRKLSRLLEESPASRTLASAIKSSDEALKWGTRIILSQLPVSMWEAETTQKMILSVSERLASEARSSDDSASDGSNKGE